MVVKKRNICYKWSVSKPRIKLGETKISKSFARNGLVQQFSNGTVINRRREGQHFIYMIMYDDDDTEEMFANEVYKCMRSYMVAHQTK